MSSDYLRHPIRDRTCWLLVAFAAVAVVFGIQDIVVGPSDRLIPLGLTGRTNEELAAESVYAYRMYDFADRTQALGLVALGLLLLAVLVGPYRRGERWAWRAVWILPAWALGIAAMYPVRPRPGA